MTQSPNEETGLVRFLSENSRNDPSFPQADIDYYRRFQQLDAYLNDKVHPSVNQGAAAKGDGWLTDHGTRHITTVIRRASTLVTDGESVFLTPYEAFILLAAIHIHDVGNVFGRDKHGEKIAMLMQELDESLIGSDGVEKRMIRDIAMAHGGYADTDGHDKDTIGRLSWESFSGGSEPRVQLLAAVLRFADELADDYTRTRPVRCWEPLEKPRGSRGGEKYLTPRTLRIIKGLAAGRSGNGRISPQGWDERVPDPLKGVEEEANRGQPQPLPARNCWLAGSLCDRMY